MVVGCDREYSVDWRLYLASFSPSCLAPLLSPPFTHPLPPCGPIMSLFHPSPSRLPFLPPVHGHFLANLTNHYSRFYSKTASLWKLFLASLAEITLSIHSPIVPQPPPFYSLARLKWFDWLIYFSRRRCSSHLLTSKALKSGSVCYYM